MQPHRQTSACSSASRAALEGLCDLLSSGSVSEDEGGADAKVAATRELVFWGTEPLALAALRTALGCAHASVRIAAVRALSLVGDPEGPPRFAQLVREDPAWTVRAAALEGLCRTATWRWAALAALDDPHWRARNALIGRLTSWAQEDPTLLAALRRRLGDEAGRDPRSAGVLRYLSYRLGAGPGPETMEAEALPPDPLRQAAFWDEDPKVVHRLLVQMGKDVRRELAHFARLLSFEDEGVRRIAVDGLRRWGGPRELRQCLRLSAEPRTPYLLEGLHKVLEYLNLDRREELGRLILAEYTGPTHGGPDQGGDEACLVWALGQVGESLVPLPPEEDRGLWTSLRGLVGHDSERVRAAAVAAWARLPLGPARRERSERLRHALHDKAESVRVAALAGLAGEIELDEAFALLGGADAGLMQRRALGRLLAGAAPTARHAPFFRAAADDNDAQVRRLCAEALVRGDVEVPEAVTLLDRLAADWDPAVRAAALTPRRAALVIAGEEETSWRVRKRAAILLRRPLPALTPSLDRADEVPPASGFAAQPDLAPASGSGQLNHDDQDDQDDPHAAGGTSAIDVSSGVVRRPLGGTGWSVAPLGISGHYGLPERGFEHAAAAGVNLFFWEPGYTTQTRFFQHLSPARRAALCLCCGSFEADPRAIRKDAERALRTLRLERVGVFVLFWVRSPARCAAAVLDAMRQMQHEGLVHAIGVSTHRRDLALSVLRDGIDLLMVRHSAAHRGAEDEVFPLARQRGTALLTFNNLCYGRLLQNTAGPTLTPAACYRYSLSQPGVSACWSAPRDPAQLMENLDVLRSTDLSATEIEALRRHGDPLRRDNRAFTGWVRSR